MPHVQSMSRRNGYFLSWTPENGFETLLYRSSSSVFQKKLIGVVNFLCKSSFATDNERSFLQSMLDLQPASARDFLLRFERHWSGERIGILHFPSFDHIAGVKLEKGWRLFNALFIVLDVVHSDHFYAIDKVVHVKCKQCFDCGEYYPYVHDKCVAVSSVSTDEVDFNLHSFKPCSVSEKRFDDGVFVRYTYDFETFTDYDKYHRVICVCVYIDLFCFDSSRGQIPLHEFDDDSYVTLIDAVDKVMTDNGFVRDVSTDFGLEENDHGRGYYIIFSPGDITPYENMEIELAVVRSQMMIYDLFLNDPIVRSALYVLCVQMRLPKSTFQVSLLSASFNGGSFDEVPLLKIRLYAEEMLRRFRYVVKGGRCYAMNLHEEVEFFGETMNVNFTLHDVIRFWVGSLRKVAQELNLPVQKGDMDFRLINDLYNMTFFDVFDWTEMPWHILDHYSSFTPDKIEEMKTYMKGCDTIDCRKMILNYCMHDVIVTCAADNEFGKALTNATLPLISQCINHYCTFGTAHCAQILMWKYCELNEIQLFAPTGSTYDLISRTILGGRSEIKALGVIDEESVLIDINSMYGGCQRSLYPKGKGGVASKVVLDKINEFLKRVKSEGFRFKHGVDPYRECASDFGMLFAYFDARAPPERERKSWCPVPYRTKNGLIWSNESRVAQPLTLIDAELLARAGFDVCVRKDMDNVYFPECEYTMRGYIDVLLQNRSKATSDTLKNMYKSLMNSAYGKNLQKPIYNKHDFAKSYRGAGGVRLNRLKPFMSFSSSSSENSKWNKVVNDVIPLRNPLDYSRAVVDEAFTNDILLVNYSYADGSQTNSTPCQLGACTLSYSRMEMAILLSMVEDENDNHKHVQDRSILYWASETDSLHMPKKVFDRIPLEMISSKEVGGWCEQCKRMEFFFKFEDFASLTREYKSIPCIYTREYIFGKKFYFCCAPEETHKSKYACKGLDKSAMNLEFVHSVMNAYYFNCETGIIEKPDVERHVVRETIARDLMGVKSHHEFKKAPIRSVLLKRVMRPNFNGTRISPHQRSMYLTDGFLKLLMFDDENPSPVPMLSYNETLHPQSYFIDNDCEDEFCDSFMNCFNYDDD